MRTVFRSGVVALGLCFLAGCSGKGKATVTGKVTHQGKTVVSGTVEMKGPDGISIPGTINPDGTYRIEGVTSGAVQISVISNDPGTRGYRPGMSRGSKDGSAAPAAPPPDLPKWFAIPAKYADMATSGLSTTLSSGSNTHDIELP